MLLPARSTSTPGYVSRLLRLPSLAPDIITAIVNGKNPPQLTAKKLMRLALEIPVDWTEQRKLLGFQHDKRTGSRPPAIVATGIVLRLASDFAMRSRELGKLTPECRPGDFLSRDAPEFGAELSLPLRTESARHRKQRGFRREIRLPSKRHKIVLYQVLSVAGAPGFEPGITGPKPVALPLGHAPMKAIFADRLGARSRF